MEDGSKVLLWTTWFSPDHPLRLIDKATDWSFIYGLVRNKYSLDAGRPTVIFVRITRCWNTEQQTMMGLGSTKAAGMCVKAALIVPNTGSRGHVKLAGQEHHTLQSVLGQLPTDFTILQLFFCQCFCPVIRPV